MMIKKIFYLGTSLNHLPNNRRNANRLLLILLLLGSISQISNRTGEICTGLYFSETNEVRILLIMDNPFGPEYYFTREILEDRFGWIVDTFSLEKNIVSCDNWQTDLTVDYTLENLPSVSNYDIISVMPGPSHDNLIVNEAILNYIEAANDRNIIVSAWCRGVRVLAYTDVLEGRHITGHWDYQQEYSDAGAIFHIMADPIIDENIVTCATSSRWRWEMCIALAEAVGVYESTKPEISTIDIINEGKNHTISVNATDASGVYSVIAEIYLLTDGNRTSQIPDITTNLQRVNDTDIFCASVKIPKGIYSIDITAEDIYYNSRTETNEPDITIKGLSLTHSIILFCISSIFATLIWNKKMKKD